MLQKNCYFRSLIQENLEYLVIAVIFVMILRFFCIEPFKIPTTSMEPTLIGDPTCGDHILVNKFIYHLRKPQRWEVIVFKYPLNSKRNFIKRLIGLPGETVAIQNGNIYINGELTRKPPEVQRSLRYPLFVGKHTKDAYHKFWRTKEGEWNWHPPNILLKAEQSAWCIYDKEITNEYRPHHDRLFFKRARHGVTAGGEQTVGEIAISFYVLVKSTQGKVLVQIRHGIHRFCLSLGSSKSYLTWYHDEEIHQTIAIPFAWQRDKKYQIAMDNFDELVSVAVDGKTIATMDYQEKLDNAHEKTYESRVQFGGESGLLEFSEISLWRDIYYLGRRDVFAGTPYLWHVPAHHCFVLGDNSPHSNDSRDWKIFRVLLKNGTFLEGDQQAPPYEENNHYRFTDIYGAEREISLRDRRDTISDIPYPYVPYEYLLGRGFGVFWPPNRIKIIR